MKFIHLSDLHLGKRVNEYSMLEDQEYILKKIINIVDAEKPDGVIIAGDVYDKSVPAAEAVQLFDDFLVQLAKRKLEVFVISGNHDSPERIAFGSRIMDASGIHMSPVYNGKIVPFSMQDEYGTVDVYMLPFIKPAHVRRFCDDEIFLSTTSCTQIAQVSSVDYFAVHKNQKSDYNRLFLVIDDPVSSMDFNYVYNVAQAIRNIKKEPEIGRIRYLVLTHNMEFMSILVRNKIVSKKFLLSDGAISDFKDDYVMPYTANLLDIYKVSIGGMKPIHTIPNQIRHVLETTYRFEGSCGGFDDYILNNEILGKNGCLYSLIEDHSHGGLRTSKGYTDNMLIDSCRMVVDFIASKYPGQIEEVKRLSA